MFDRLPTLAVIFAIIAGLIHVLFFVLESLMFRRPFAWRTFGIASQQDADITHDWALNQGFYNLFLAVGALVGVLLAGADNPTTVAAGVGMVLVATGSMLGAAIVLLVTKPKLLRGVLIQGVAPLVTIVAMLVS